MGTWIYFREGKAAIGEEMGAAFHMPCPLKQWFSTCHRLYGLSRLWDPLPLPLLYVFTDSYWVVSSFPVRAGGRFPSRRACAVSRPGVGVA